MTSTDVAVILGALAALITSIAALRSSNYNAARMSEVEKENARLKDANDKKTEHNEYQDKVILDQQRKINQWFEWGERIGRKMNQMELSIGASRVSKHIDANDDTQPLPTQKDWITGKLGPIDVSALKKMDDHDP